VKRPSSLRGKAVPGGAPTKANIWSFTQGEHPFLASGGVACTTEFHFLLADEWKRMKSSSQVRGPLHAARHLKGRSTRQWRAVSAAMSSPVLERFCTILTDTTSVSARQVTRAALSTLANRFADIAGGMLACGLWHPHNRLLAIFEHSARLADSIEKAFTGNNAATKNVKLQRTKANHLICTPAFRSLFRDVGPPLASYIEVTYASYRIEARHSGRGVRVRFAPGDRSAKFRTMTTLCAGVAKIARPLWHWLRPSDHRK